MIKLVKNNGLILLVFIILFISFLPKVGAFSYDFNPITFVQKVADIVATRISDTVYYLILQKKYIFDNFTDPNIYSSFDNLTSLNETTFLNNTSPDKTVMTAKPITVATPTLPGLKIIKSDSIPEIISGQTSLYNNNSSILYYTNYEREAVLLKPLISNYILDIVASLKADDLFANQYFEHISPGGQSVSDLARNNGYDYLLIGENLALGNFNNDQDIVSAWMESPGHKANILNEKYTEVGVAVKEGIYDGENTIIAVQVFGLPLKSCGKPNSEIKVIIDSSSVSIKQMQAQALLMYENLDTIKNNPNVDSSYYNQKIQEYNYYAKKINDAVLALKGMIDIYNTGVSSYNSCINQ